MSGTSIFDHPMRHCGWCGHYHGPRCPEVRAIEYHEDGFTIKRVEFVTERTATEKKS